MPKPIKFHVMEQATISGKTAVLERFHTAYGTKYRLTAAERFDNLEEAKQAPMNEFPESKWDKLPDSFKETNTR